MRSVFRYAGGVSSGQREWRLAEEWGRGFAFGKAVRDIFRGVQLHWRGEDLSGSCRAFLWFGGQDREDSRELEEGGAFGCFRRTRKRENKKTEGEIFEVGIPLAWGKLPVRVREREASCKGDSLSFRGR